MRFFHISDLHIGKRVCGFSMLEDQRYILKQITALAAEKRPDGVLIAGDLYDKSMPSAEAVELADDFLYELSRLGIPVWAISGNHDSAERVAYGGRMMEQAGLHMSRVFDGRMQKYTLSPKTEKDTETDIYLLPYIRPAQVRRFYPEEEIETTQQAVQAVLKKTALDRGHVNILLMHQFLAGAILCESEEVSVGGSDQVDVRTVSDFDYVALGHLHGPQKVGRDNIRYCGSPLKYSFSEVSHKKSVTVIETGLDAEAAETAGENIRWEDRGAGETAGKQIRISTVPLTPLRDMREVRGPLDQLLSPEVYEMADCSDYLHVTLTDEKEILDAIGKLREVYPNIMRLDFAISQIETQVMPEDFLSEETTPQELFEEFFLLQNGFEMGEEQKKLAEKLWKDMEDNC